MNLLLDYEQDEELKQEQEQEQDQEQEQEKEQERHLANVAKLARFLAVASVAEVRILGR